MPALPENILTQITNFGHNPRLQDCYLQAVDLAQGEDTPWGTADGIRFQYWPETLQDSRTSDWTPRAIPGGSHPIYQWTHGGERTFSFTAIFTTDTNPGDDYGQRGLTDPLGEETFTTAYSEVEGQPANGLRLKSRDIDLRTVVSWLRWFTYPKYEGAGSSSRVFEPAKALLVMPNTSLGWDGSDAVLTVMRQCQVTYQAWFPNGVPRILEVSLEFAEVVQSGARVGFQSRDRMRPAVQVRKHLARSTDTQR